MARETFEDWIPVEVSSEVLQEVLRVSAVEAEATPEPMSSDTKQIPRSGDFAIANVAKGAAYGETAGTNDYVELIARKAGGILRVAEEDLIDTTVGMGVLDAKKLAAGRNMAKYFDNAALAVTAAANGTTVPYTSIYRAVRTNDSGAGYTADANYTGGAVTYANISTWLSKYEESPYADDSDTVIIAHPAMKKTFRDLLDGQNRPILIDAMTQSTREASLMGYRLRWSYGAKTSATATSSPTGNPLMIIGNRQLMRKGMARLSPQIASPNPGFALQRAATGVGFTTDEALLKASMRRGFVIGYPQAFSVFEKTS